MADVEALQRDLNQALARIHTLEAQARSRSAQADILRKQFRTVPSKHLELIDKDIIEECLHTQEYGKPENKDEQGAAQINFRTLGLKRGVNEKTISRRINHHLMYCNLFEVLYQDTETGRWFAKINLPLYKQVASAYHAAAEVAAKTGQKISDPGLIQFSRIVKSRGTPRCKTCGTPTETRKVTKLTEYCPKCKTFHEKVKDTGWVKPEAQGQGAPAESPDESPGTTCPAFKKQLPPHDALVDLYLDLAGEDEKRIRMIASEQKYETLPGQVVQEHINAHLAGDDTYGSRMWRPDGLTRGFLVDGDSKAAIERLEQGAVKLAAAGWIPIREYIPEKRPRKVAGYHDESRRYVLVKDALVDVRAGWQEIYRIAPEWEGLEHWPLPGEARGNRTRLPGGVYRMPGFSDWCELYSITDYESSSDGVEAAALLYTHQSPASLIPPYTAPPDPEGESDHITSPPLPEKDLDQAPAQSDNNHFLIAFKAANLVARFADEHQLADYLERGKNGKYYSPNGSERTASAALYCKDGRELLTDFSTHGARSDGTHDTVDALELYSRQSGRTKRVILSELGQLVHRDAKAAIEAAARDGTPLPGWIESRMTDYGRATYERLRQEAGGVTALDSEGGAVATPAPRAVPSFQIAPWMIDTPCQRCGLPFQMRYAGINASICPRCCPPRGGYPPEWDTRYPRKKRRGLPVLLAAVMP